MSHSEIKKPTDITVPAGSMWAKLPMLGGVAAVVGLGATLGAAFGEGRDRAMFSWLWAYEVFLGLGLAALGWLVIDHTVRSSWSIVVRRIAETMAVTLPVFIVLWLPIGTLGMHSLFPWTHEVNDPILAKKLWFLSDGRFYMRAVVYFVIWGGLSWFLYSNSVKQDALGNDQAARDVLVKKAWTVSAAGIFLYGLSQSFQAIDWVMSLQPHWYSTIFGVYFFAASIQAFFAVMVLIANGLQRAGMLKETITTEHFHDLGKFTYGFTVFWAYIAFSQFILIWYANIPEETVFYMTRLEGGWDKISYALPLGHFFLPFFFLLSRNVKRHKVGLQLAAVWVVLWYLVDLYWLILPNFGTHGEPAQKAVFAPTWTDATALIGMAGAFFAAFGYFLNRNKVVAINDPRLPESLVHENY